MKKLLIEWTTLPDLKISKDPPIALAKAELKWWNWAINGLISVLEDENFIMDNPDIGTKAGQLADLKYRLEVQALEVAETDASEQERAAINSLTKKLRKAKFYLEL